MSHLQDEFPLIPSWFSGKNGATSFPVILRKQIGLPIDWFPGRVTMKIEMRKAGKVQILDLCGDFATERGNLPVQDTVQDLLDKGEKRIVLNLKQVRWIDSGGLGLLIVLKKRSAQAGADVKLLMPSKKVQDLFTMVRLNEIYEILDSELDAVGSF